MKTASAGLVAYLNSTQTFFMADLYTFTLVGGLIVRYTNADIDITYNGDTYSKFMISRSRTKVSIGVEVDQLDISINAAPIDLLNGVGWPSAVRNGALDGAQLLLQRIFMPTWGDSSLGALIMFSGRVSDVQMGRTEAQLSVKSEMELLDTQMPRNLYQSGCINTLFDDACSLNKASFAVNGTVTTATLTQVNSALGQAANYFSLGTVTFTSGVNNGISRSVRAFASGSFIFSLPLVNAPSPGDTFKAYPGCDKLQATCSGKFNNLVNFRGYPYVPDPETAT